MRQKPFGIVTVSLLMLLVTSGVAQVDQPGVRLNTDEIETIANRVRAGRSLQPERWPNAIGVWHFDAGFGTAICEFVLVLAFHPAG